MQHVCKNAPVITPLPPPFALHPHLLHALTRFEQPRPRLQPSWKKRLSWKYDPPISLGRLMRLGLSWSEDSTRLSWQPAPPKRTPMLSESIWHISMWRMLPTRETWQQRGQQWRILLVSLGGSLPSSVISDERYGLTVDNIRIVVYSRVHPDVIYGSLLA